MPKKAPKKRFPCIRPRWNETEQRFQWRARVRIDQQERIGPWRWEQEDAYQDVVDIKARLGQGLGVIVTLADAARALRAKKEAQGLSERSLKALDHQEAFLLKHWKADAPLAAIDASDIGALIGKALKPDDEDERPRSPNTILDKDLVYIARLLKIAGLPTAPVDVARDETRQHLKRQPPRMEWFEPEKVREIVDRMRHEVFKDKRGRVLTLDAREFHADIVLLFATTGIRSGELSRLTVDDVNLDRQVVRIISKDRGHPRDAQILSVAIEPLERLVARAVKAGEKKLVPGGERFLSVMFARWKARLGETKLSGRALRHSFGSFVFHMARNPAEAKAVLGHRSMATTQRYLHELGMHEKESLKKIDDWWSQEPRAKASSSARGQRRRKKRSAGRGSRDDA